MTVSKTNLPPNTNFPSQKAATPSLNPVTKVALVALAILGAALIGVSIAGLTISGAIIPLTIAAIAGGAVGAAFGATVVKTISVFSKMSVQDESSKIEAAKNNLGKIRIVDNIFKNNELRKSIKDLDDAIANDNNDKLYLAIWNNYLVICQEKEWLP